MILALSRFRVKNGMEAEVRAAFVARPRRVEDAPGFAGLEVLTETADPSAFVLVTRWHDEGSFSTWHRGPLHHAAHAFMPPGLKLDPEGTELIVAERVVGATSEGEIGDLLLDCASPIGRLVWGGTSTHVFVLDEAQLVVSANPAAMRLCSRAVLGASFATLLVEENRSGLAQRLSEENPSAFHLNFVGPRGEPMTLRCTVARRPRGHILLGEPRWDDHHALEEQLQKLNAELAVLSREHARQARALEAAHQELRDSHWHIRKIAEVLPVCLACRKVRTGDETWEDLSTFLLEHSNFLSHGYCARCEKTLERAGAG